MRLKFLALGLAMAGAALLSACGGGERQQQQRQRQRASAQRQRGLRLARPARDGQHDGPEQRHHLRQPGFLHEPGHRYEGSAAARHGQRDHRCPRPATASLIKDHKLTVIAWGQNGALGNLVLDEEETAPEANKSKLLVINLASGSGTLDTYLTEATTALADVSRRRHPPSPWAAGDSYRTQGQQGLPPARHGRRQQDRSCASTCPRSPWPRPRSTPCCSPAPAGGNMVNATLLEYKGAQTELPKRHGQCARHLGLAARCLADGGRERQDPAD